MIFFKYLNVSVICTSEIPAIDFQKDYLKMTAITSIIPLFPICIERQIVGSGVVEMMSVEGNFSIDDWAPKKQFQVIVNVSSDAGNSFSIDWFAAGDLCDTMQVSIGNQMSTSELS